jgi:(p)ppGpp synthase/HD superfamily hydrolase
MRTRAATILELWGQLRRQGYADADLSRLHQAYELVVSLCACEYRSSGRPIIDHAVGVAAVLSDLKVKPPLVVAGLAHLVYLHGDFGGWLRRIDERKRARVKRVLGEKVEEHVYRYSRLEWYGNALLTIAARLPVLADIDREVVLLRLADQLEIFERDAAYCDNADQRRAYARRYGPDLVALAGAVGGPALASSLQRALSDDDQTPIAGGLTSPPFRDGVIVPPSYRTRPSIAVYRRLRSTVYALTGR